jgi:hypothetical protein
VITDHARLLAREVIKRARESYASGAISGDLDYCRDNVIHTRWPVRGRGGVAMVNAQTQREVRAAIAEFYQPSESKEPNT